MMVIDALPGKTVLLGRLGENEARTVRFLVGNILYHYPAATFTVLNQRPGDPAAYPVANCELEGSYVNWLLTDSDLSKVGNGQCELVARQDGVVVKTVIYTTKIDNALDGAGTPPEPWESWVEDVIDAADRADAAAALLEHPGAEAETLEPGSQATAGYSDGTFSFGIPKGEKGNPGNDGVSPTVTITAITGGHRITITDAEGDHTADVMDGTDGDPGTPGQDGISPTVTITSITGGHRITITDKNGNHTADVMDGQDGHSPVITTTKSGKTTTILSDGESIGTVLDGEDGDPTTLIDDTSTAQNKVWSANKSDSEVGGLKSAFDSVTEQKVSINLYDKDSCNPSDGKSYWNGILYDNSTYATTGKIPVDASTQYIFSAGDLRSKYVEYFSGDSGETYQSRENVDGAFTTPSGCTYVAVMFFGTSHTTAQYNAAIAVAQLEKGSTVHDFKPYGNTVYIPLNDVEASASASDEGKAIIVKSVEDGKVTEWELGNGIVNNIIAEKPSTNLYDKNSCNPENGKVYWNGTKSTGDNYATTGKIPVEEETQYIFYAGGATVMYCEYFSGESGGTFISRETLNGAAFTTPENCTYVAIMLFGTSHTTDQYNAAIAAGQLNEGSTVLPFEPFDAVHYYVPFDAMEEGDKLKGIDSASDVQPGMNMYDKTLAENRKCYNSDGSILTNADNYAISGMIPVEPNTQYCFSKDESTALTIIGAVYEFNSSGEYTGTITTGLYGYSNSYLLSFATSSTTHYVSFNLYKISHTEQEFNETIDTIMLTYGTTRPYTYSAYKEEVFILSKKLDNAYFNPDCFSGKTWLATGTSITWYDGKKYQAGVNTGIICRGYVGNISRRKKLIVINDGINGATLGNQNSNSLINRYTSLPWSSVDIATIEFGVNDLGNSIPVGTASDAAGTTTFAACLKTVIEYALAQNPKIILIICTEPDVRGTVANSNGNTLKDYSDVTLAIAAQYRLPVCDWYYHSGINALNKGDQTKEWMTVDGTHPSDAGHQRMGAMLLQVMEGLID